MDVARKSKQPGRVQSMHINNAEIHRVLSVHLNKVYGPANSTAIDGARRPDELILSPKAAEMQKVKQTIADLPDVRTSLINSIRSKIDAESYTFDSRDLADCIASAATASGRVGGWNQ